MKSYTYLCLNKKNQMIALQKIANSQDVFFIFLLVAFLIISIIKGLYWKHARLFFLGVIAQRYANQFLREENVFTQRVSTLAFLLMSINFTLLILKLLNLNSNSLYLVFMFVVVFYFFKWILIRSLGILYKFDDLSKITIFFSFLFDKTLALVLFPLIVVVYYFAFDVTSAVLCVAIWLFVFFLILKLFWLWKIGATSFGLNRFYIFLYLCIVEISPFLLLAKGVFY